MNERPTFNRQQVATGRIQATVPNTTIVMSKPIAKVKKHRASKHAGGWQKNKERNS